MEHDSPTRYDERPKVEASFSLEGHVYGDVEFGDVVPRHCGKGGDGHVDREIERNHLAGRAVRRRLGTCRVRHVGRKLRSSSGSWKVRGELKAQMYRATLWQRRGSIFEIDDRRVVRFKSSLKVDRPSRELSAGSRNMTLFACLCQSARLFSSVSKTTVSLISNEAQQHVQRSMPNPNDGGSS